MNLDCYDGGVGKCFLSNFNGFESNPGHEAAGERSEEGYDEMLSFLLWRNKCTVDFPFRPSLNINNGNC